MDLRLRPLAAILETNTYLFGNCLEGVDEAQALARIDGRTNHLAFLAAHLVGSRAYLAGALGGDGTDPFQALLGDARTIDDVARFPSLAEIRAAWPSVTARLMEALAAVDPAALDRPAPAAFPIGDPSVLGMAAFLVQHDSYHIGQMALLRKHLGFGAMSYDPPENA